MLSVMQGGWLGKAMIHRSEHTNDYMVVNRDIVRNTSLSDGAVRLLLFMLSCSDDFEFSARGLSSLLGMSLGAISDRLKELQDAGYIDLTPTRAKGRFGSFVWDVYESPCSTLPNTEIPNSVRITEFYSTEQGKTERISNTNIKEIANKRNSKEKKGRTRFVPPTIEEVRAYCEERNNGVDPERWFSYYSANGWKVGRNSMKDWKASVNYWARDSKAKTPQAAESPNNSKIDEALKIALQRAEGGIS